MVVRNVLKHASHTLSITLNAMLAMSPARNASNNVKSLVDGLWRLNTGNFWMVSCWSYNAAA
jgi:hypothetical protein